MCVKPFSLTKNEGKLFLVPKSSGPLLARLPLKLDIQCLTDVLLMTLRGSTNKSSQAVARKPGQVYVDNISRKQNSVDPCKMKTLGVYAPKTNAVSD